MPNDVVIARHEPCTWLPKGGRAEVVLAGGSEAPGPTPVARLLVTAGDHVLVVPRPDGRGPDLPTAPVPADGATDVAADVASSLRQLTSSVVEGAPTPRLVGFVRNTVPNAPADYPWPAPVAHFAVWHIDSGKGRERRGRWLDPAEAERQLSDRHWWPLAARAGRG
jgi:hypothetical protein